jgi:hypothetical protein
MPATSLPAVLGMRMTDLPFLQPFVVAHEPVEPFAAGGLDLYPGARRSAASGGSAGTRRPGPGRAAAVRTPVLLVRVEHETDKARPGQQEFATACPDLSVIDVPGAHHGFETIDDTPAAHAAIADSVAWAADRARHGTARPRTS